MPYNHHWNAGYRSAFKMCVSLVIFSTFIVWLFPLQTWSWLIAEISMELTNVTNSMLEIMPEIPMFYDIRVCNE
jgi:uncharacterized membrane protein SpoIIM required for sporulation